MFKRVIIKVSGEQLAGGSDVEHFDGAFIKRIVTEVDHVSRRGCEAGLVVGGGNIWRGRDANPSMDKAKAHHMGMLATVINAIYLADQFRVYADRKAVVMTPFDVNGFTARYSQESANECMRRGTIPIFAGGSGHPFLSTDTITAIRACELRVDAVLYGKTVSSVYDKDPRRHRDARRLRSVSYETVLRDSLDVADIAALSITHGANLASVVFGIAIEGSILTACEGVEGLFRIGGTYIADDAQDVYY
ncbi:MAG: UMP kinase [Defluviitaleaceae bacterium]|nr:UMP kinase [Defluviitaleaceae bacterium]